MRYSWQLRRKAVHDLRDNKCGRMRVRLQVLAAVGFVALLMVGPMLHSKPPITEPAEQAGSERATAGGNETRIAGQNEKR